MDEYVMVRRKVVEQALIALEAAADDEGGYRIYKDALDALRAELAAAPQGDAQ